MCNPMLAVAAFSAATQLYSGYQQNKMAKHQAQIQEDTANYNARSQENEAQRIKNIGIEEENDHRRMVAEMQAEQKAGFGAGNVQVNTGDALRTQEDTASIGEVDALRIRRNYKDQADAVLSGAELTRSTGRNQAAVTRAEGKSALVNSALSSVGTVASSWYSPKSAAVVQSNNVAGTSGGGNIHSTSYLRSQRV